MNDRLDRVTNFYKVIQSEFGLLRKLILETPHSRGEHRKAKEVLKNPDFYNPIRRAWAFWVQCNLSFSGRLFGGYAYQRLGSEMSRRIRNKKKLFNKTLKQRLELTDIENNDAITVIKSRDTEETFFYIDPPYVGSNCGHYTGYTLDDFKTLLYTLTDLKGKFILSSYASEVLDWYADLNGWYQMTHTKKIAVHKDIDRNKTEVITANFDIHQVRKENTPKGKLERWKKYQAKPQKQTVT